MRYVAFLRGISPTIIKNEKLKEIFTGMGLKNVKTVISSGNVIFESDRKNEERIGNEVSKHLNFKCSAMVLSEKEIEELIESDPFYGMGEGKQNITFFKTKPELPKERPFMVKADGRMLFSVISHDTGTLELMEWLETTFGKEITTRTWKTISRIQRSFSQT